MVSNVYYDQGAAVYNALADWAGKLTNTIYGDDDGNAQPGLAELFEYALNNVGGLNQGGGRVYLPPGTYRIEANLVLPVGLTLVFAEGARIKAWDQDPTVHLEILGSIEAGPYPIILYPETNPCPIRFGPGSTERVYSEWFGARAGSVFDPDDSNHPDLLSHIAVDSTAAFRAAVASLPHAGGTIRLVPGQYRISDEIVIDRSAVKIVGSARQGLLTDETPQHGSYLAFDDPPESVVPNPWAGKSMIRFTSVTEIQDSQPNPALATANWGGGVHGVSFVQYTGARGRRCQAAVHVEDCVAFSMSDCTFDWILGSALRVSGATQCSFRNIKVKRCGASSAGYDPAVHLPGTEAKPASSTEPARFCQGSVFTGFKVESCEDAPYVHVGAGNKANKFDDFGFEALPDEINRDTWQTFLRVNGQANQFGKIHFNRQSINARDAKLVVDAPRCQFDELLFRGQSGLGGSVEFTENAAECHVNSVLIRTFLPPGFGPYLSPQDAYAALAGYPQIRVDGSRNQFGRITCVPTNSNSEFGWLSVKGNRNQFGQVVDATLFGVVLQGDRNKLLSLVSSDRPHTALTVLGRHCDVLQADIDGCSVASEPVVRIGPETTFGIPGEAPPEDETNGSRVRVRIVDAPSASEGILVSARDVQLLQGSRIEGISNGSGLRWTGVGGGFEGIEVVNIGHHGIHVDGGSPTSMTNWIARKCGTENRVTSLGGATYGAFLASADSTIDDNAVCTGFVIREDGSNHAFSIKVEPAGSGGTSYDNWIFEGNLADGGPVSLPTTGTYAADFDSQGRGPDITADSTIDLGDSASFFTVDGTTAIANITASWPGRQVTLRFDDSVSIQTTGNLKIGSQFNATADDTLTLVCDGSNWFEVCRSVN